jgi:hypothetical protein
MKYLKNSQRIRIKYLFDLFNQNQNGDLEISELSRLLRIWLKELELYENGFDFAWQIIEDQITKRKELIMERLLKSFCKDSTQLKRE